MNYSRLILDKTGGVATITLNRPDRSNSFDEALVQEMHEALRDVDRNAAVRSIVLTGAGKNFCAGQDLQAIVDRYDTPAGVGFREHLMKSYNQMVARLRLIEKPVIAAVNGAAAGAGLGLACACDIRYASENAKFRMAFIGIGLAPDSATSFLLPRLIGFGRALELAMTNELIDARTALSYGLVNRVLAADELLPRTLELAARLAAAPTRAIGLTKRAFNHGLDTGLEHALDYEAYLQEIAGRTADHREGVRAFLDKRTPEYSGK